MTIKSMVEIGDSIHRVETLLRDLKELDDGAKVSRGSLVVSFVSLSNVTISVIVIIIVMDSGNLSFLSYFSGAIF